MAIRRRNFTRRQLDAVLLSGATVVLALVAGLISYKSGMAMVDIAHARPDCMWGPGGESCGVIAQQAPFLFAGATLPPVLWFMLATKAYERTRKLLPRWG